MTFAGWLFWAVFLFVAWALLRKRSSGAPVVREFRPSEFGDPGKPLTLAKAKTALRRALLELSPRMHRESVACEVEDFDMAVHDRLEALESAIEDAENDLADAECTLESAESDLEEARDELIADPRRTDRDALKADMARHIQARREAQEAIQAAEQSIKAARAELQALRKDKRAFLAKYLNTTRSGGHWRDLIE